MFPTPSEYYTNQFYTWDSRCRGWFLADTPIDLEPPFIPYYRHGYRAPKIDDGKRPTIVSRIIESIKGKKITPTTEEEILDYENLEIFPIEERNLTAIQIKLPKDRKILVEKMKALIVMLYQTESHLAFEIIGNAKEIVVQFVGSENDINQVEIYTKAYFPDINFLFDEKYILNIFCPGLPTNVIDFGLQQEIYRSLPTQKNFNIDSLTGLFGILETFEDNQQGGIQILFKGTVNHWSESIARGVTLRDGSSFFGDVPDAPKMAMEKTQSPLYGVTIRAFGQTNDEYTASRITEQIAQSVINASKGSLNQLIPLPTECYDFDTRINDIYLRQSHRMGMLLTVDELLTLLHFPSENIQSKKLLGATRKTKLLPNIAKGKAFILGENYHNGVTTDVTVNIDDRLKHTHIIGATGTGKSTLIANLILQDINKGIGIVLFDPHGDLVDDIIARIPTERLTDVVLVDPADSEYPIGLNILKAINDTEKEVLSSDLVAAFRRYATSWGDQMNAVFGNAIIAILENENGGTLHDLRRFLIERDFRNEYLKGVKDRIRSTNPTLFLHQCCVILRK